MNYLNRKLMSVAVMMAAEAAGSAGGRGKFCEKDFDLDTGEVSFAFGNGETVKVIVDLLPDDMKRTLMLHGMSQKGGDSYAGAKGNFAEGIANLKEVIAALQAGQWNGGRDGEGKPRLGELSAAIARVKGVSLEDATAAVTAAYEAGETGAEKLKTWRAHPKIKAAIAAIRSEKAQKELEAAEGVDDLKL